MNDKIVNAGYVIEQELHISDSVIVLGVNPNLVGKEHTSPYVTWETDEKKESFNWGHYYTEKYSAERDLVKRGMDKVRFYDRIMGYNKGKTEREAR
jgi:hypothetical protein